jgi:hypothetical protein
MSEAPWSNAPPPHDRAATQFFFEKDPIFPVMGLAGCGRLNSKGKAQRKTFFRNVKLN